MAILVTILHVIVCLVLILVILLQAGRGQGLTGATFGSGNVQSLFGTRAGDFLTKATTISAICFLVTVISLDFLEARKSRSLMELETKAAPVNLDQIKEALEKVKSEMAKEGQQPAAATETAAPAVAETAAVETTAAETTAQPAAVPEAQPAEPAAAQEPAQPAAVEAAPAAETAPAPQAT